LGRRLVGVDLLRAVAILLAVGLHWRAVAVQPNGMGRWLDLAFLPGTYGVTLFFVISGFLICRTTMQREHDFFRLSIRSFYLRRAGRVQPLLWATVLVATLVILFLGNSNELFLWVFQNQHLTSPTFWLSLSTFTFNWYRIAHRAQDWGLGLQWGILWSLAVEEQFYLVFPLMVILARTRERLIRILLFVAVIGAATKMIAHLEGAGWLVLATNSFSCLDALAMGVLTALVSERLSLGRVTSDAIAIGGAILIVMACLSGNSVGVVFGASAFILGSLGGKLFTWQMWRPISRVGELSYGVYLLHPMTLYILSPWLSKMSFSLGFAVFFAITTAIAQFSYLWFEQPASRFIISKGMFLLNGSTKEMGVRVN
jgi:peptidoglycan/LPS O-acetylase OafA/YrhL